MEEGVSDSEPKKWMVELELIVHVFVKTAQTPNLCTWGEIKRSR